MGILMKYLSYFVISLCCIHIFGQSSPTGILNIYLDPATASIPGVSGVVILTLNNGIQSTICANSDKSTNDAIVACRMLNYTIVTSPSVLSAVAFISSIKTTLAGTYFQNLSCLGTESSLAQCPGYNYANPVGFKCLNNNADLNVYCSHGYNFTKSVAQDGNCSSNVLLTKDSQQLLTLTYANTRIFFCNVANTFGINEAQLFCRMLCQNDTYARIIQGINMTGLSVSLTIGGFNKLSCPAGAASLADCANNYPFQSNGCLPTSNIGVSCSIPIVSTDNYPAVVCGSNFLTLIWNVTINPTILPEYVSIVYLNVTCTLAKTTSNNLQLNLTVSLNDCNNAAYGDTLNIIYTYSAKRTYPVTNTVVVKSDQLFTPSCYIPRLQTISHGPISINPASIAGGGNVSPVPTSLVIYSDSAFKQSVSNVLSIPIGSTLFVLISMQNPPANLVLVLSNCSAIGSPSGISVTLIKNRCPVTSNVQLLPINNIKTSFSFVSFNIPGSTSITVSCQTSICGFGEIGCLSTC